MNRSEINLPRVEVSLDLDDGWMARMIDKCPHCGRRHNYFIADVNEKAMPLEYVVRATCVDNRFETPLTLLHVSRVGTT